VLEVFEREGVRPDLIAGTSMGALIGALSASGLSAREIVEVARSFYFPRWFLPGALVHWDDLFRSAVPLLSGTFETLRIPLVVTAVDLEAGTQVILHSGSLLPAVKASCTVPGVLPAIRLDGRWLVDGSLVNPLPVDVAWLSNPQVVIAVKVGAPRARAVPQLGWRLTALLSRLGGMVPNPATAKISFEVLVRASEILIERQTTLAAAMTGPEILIEPELGDLGLRDFHRLDDAVAAGRRAAEAALPRLVALLETPAASPAPSERTVTLCFDPVCGMVVSPIRARAEATDRETTFYFCSSNCRDCFVRDPAYYLERRALEFGALAVPEEHDRRGDST
jgi:NTE family protein